MSVLPGTLDRMEWTRDRVGQWYADAEFGRYVIRGGPGAWWFEVVDAAGRVVATGRDRSSTTEARADAERAG